MTYTFVPQGAPQLSYYDVLQITPSDLDSQRDPAQALKRAYHRALLIHHPDKRKPTPSSLSPTTISPSTTSATSITIDQISTAFAVLSSPAQRSEYDRLLLTQAVPDKSQLDNRFQTGIENVDLDDLSFDEKRQEWFRGCRCGNPRGYRFNESDLEEATDFGEVMVGCADCSLWLRVHFAVVDDDEGETVGRGEGGETERGK